VKEGVRLPEIRHSALNGFDARIGGPIVHHDQFQVGVILFED